MELKEFIHETLSQIAAGVKAAIDDSQGKGYFVNPSLSGPGASYQIHFDLSVESEVEGKAGITILGAGLSERSANRISFDVAMTLPSSGNVKRPARPSYETGDTDCTNQNN